MWGIAMTDSQDHTIDVAKPETQRATLARSIGRTIAQGGKEGRLVAFVLFTFSCVLFLVLAYFVWLKLIPVIWQWGFDPVSFRAILAAIALLYAAILPGIGPLVFFKGIAIWSEYHAAQREIGASRQKQDELQDQLDVTDPQYPLKLVTYSRFMLQEYYLMAMKQAQRSFRYCLIAMWLGFAVLLVGVADYFIPLRAIAIHYYALPQEIFQSADTVFSPNTFILITGVILEFISVAFLWMYRFSIAQQTYYYRRQLRLHNVLLAKNVGESMGDGKDAAFNSIIKSLLENVEMTQIAPPKTTDLKAFAPAENK